MMSYTHMHIQVHRFDDLFNNLQIEWQQKMCGKRNGNPRNWRRRDEEMEFGLVLPFVSNKFSRICAKLRWEWCEYIYCGRGLEPGLWQITILPPRQFRGTFFVLCKWLDYPRVELMVHLVCGYGKVFGASPLSFPYFGENFSMLVPARAHSTVQKCNGQLGLKISSKKKVGLKMPNGF